MKIIANSENVRVYHDFYQGYAVFTRQTYPGGNTAFWQQASKWYQYKKYAMDIYTKRVDTETGEI